MPFLPYLQHPYAPIPTDSSTPWNIPQTISEDGETSIKKPAMSGFVDTPLNLSKPRTSEDTHRSAQKIMSNDGNNNSSKTNHHPDHFASGSKMMTGGSPRLSYNMPFNNDETDLFAACRLWPVMAAAAQHHHHNSSTNQSNNLSNMMTGNHREIMSENNFGNFGQAMSSSETSGKNKRGSDQMSMPQTNNNEDKIRVVRQQGRGRNTTDRDLIGKQ